MPVVQLKGDSVYRPKRSFRKPADRPEPGSTGQHSTLITPPGLQLKETVEEAKVEAEEISMMTEPHSTRQHSTLTPGVLAAEGDGGGSQGGG